LKDANFAIPARLFRLIYGAYEPFAVFGEPVAGN
jgi:hypothetical protein